MPFSIRGGPRYVAPNVPKHDPPLAYKHPRPPPDEKSPGLRPQAPPAAPIPKSLRSYPLAERNSLLRRDRATRSRVRLRLRSHSIQPGLCNATGAGCSATVGGVALRARRSTSSQGAITPGRRVRRTLVVSANSSAYPIVLLTAFVSTHKFP